MRVIAGQARSLKLRAPEGMDTRPTTDRIKETLFNILQGDIPGAVFVDLFAGSGGIGIEALSRGAAHAYFIENAREAALCIQDNLNHTRLARKATLLRQDVFSALSLIREKEVDIIFMDPPYHGQVEPSLFMALAEEKYVTGHTLLILEAELSKKMDFLADVGFYVEREKVYKTNKHVFIRRI